MKMEIYFKDLPILSVGLKVWVCTTKVHQKRARMKWETKAMVSTAALCREPSGHPFSTPGPKNHWWLETDRDAALTVWKRANQNIAFRRAAANSLTCNCFKHGNKDGQVEFFEKIIKSTNI